MGNIEELQREQRREAIEKLRLHSVGRLIQIVDKLAEMDLSVREIENVLRTCGLNDDCALRFGAYITAEKKKGHGQADRPMHP